MRQLSEGMPPALCMPCLVSAEESSRGTHAEHAVQVVKEILRYRAPAPMVIQVGRVPVMMPLRALQPLGLGGLNPPARISSILGY